MTALFTPSNQFYTGQFATINFQPERGWVVTFWQFGQALRYTPHTDIIEATLEVVRGGMVWASEAASRVFEMDVIGATR